MPHISAADLVGFYCAVLTLRRTNTGKPHKHPPGILGGILGMSWGVPGGVPPWGPRREPQGVRRGDLPKCPPGRTGWGMGFGLWVMGYGLCFTGLGLLLASTQLAAWPGCLVFFAQLCQVVSKWPAKSDHVGNTPKVYQQTDCQSN